MLLEEFDHDRSAIIEPWMISMPIPGFPETVVAVFSHPLFYRLAELLHGEKVAETHGADGHLPIYKVAYKGRYFGFAKAMVGAPNCVGTFEDIIAMGAKRIILTGNCGVLDQSIRDCGIIIPSKAIRDEGTSYHYAPPSDDISVNRKYIPAFLEILDRHGYRSVTGTTWTTDAFYRETREKVRKRREMGAVCVEMECAAMQAMCDFRGVEFFQYLYAGDNLDGDHWDPRSLSGHIKLDDKEKILLLAFELASKIEEEAL